MRYHVLATDYDETLARHGAVDRDTIGALERLRASGRSIVLVTGREVDDLLTVFQRVELFDRIVAENGAVLYDPATRKARVLGEAPSKAFVAALRARSIPISVGHSIVATVQPHETAVLEVIRELGLELQLIFNREAVMVLPSGTNKSTGLAEALDELGFSPHNVVGVGDAENDHAFLSVCECAVAVGNAVTSLKERADHVTAGRSSAGVRELISSLLDDDLAAMKLSPERSAIPVGVADSGTMSVAPYGETVLIAGTSGGGKSTLAKALLEELGLRKYQFCVIDPEGDHQLEDAVVIGSPTQAPSLPELMDLLAQPSQNAVVNMLGVPLADRPKAFAELIPELQKLRARSGRPHFVMVDEAHHLMPEGWAHDTNGVSGASGLLLITVHPEHVSQHVLSSVATLLVIGESPRATLEAFAAQAGVPAPPVAAAPLAHGEALFWRVGTGTPVLIKANRPRGVHRRHIRKYAAGDLGVDRSFYFRGPEEKLNLRARNLEAFLQIAEGIDDDTWLHHLRRGDYSQWLRKSIKDDDLAADVERIEKGQRPSATKSREGVRAAIEERYTAPP